MTTVSLLLLSLATADAGQPASRGVLLDFTATWCGPCQQMNPIISRLKRQGYPVRKVDVDRERQLAQQFNVRSMPTFILVVDGQEQKRIVGMTSESQLRRMLSQIPRGPKPSARSTPDPRNIAKSRPSQTPTSRGPVQMAELDAPRAPARRSSPSGFLFPFGGNASAVASAPTKPAVIRAKLDQESPRRRVTVEEDPLSSSVRVRIEGMDGVNFGSGTIIRSQPGRTVILTCGHIFRELKPNAKIEVDIFDGTQTETFVGKTIGYDLEGDVGLLSIATDTALAASPIAGLLDEVRVRQGVYSIGCGGGDPPSREDVFVTALNRYLGPDNIECTGQPLQGRSGGGLFNNEGDVVGVCVAVDPRDKRGLYAGLQVIHELLAKHELADLIPESPLPQDPVIAKAAGESVPNKRELAPPTKTAVAKGRDVSLPVGLNTPGEAEVICIVRPLNQPKSASQVVIINRASSRFVSYLTDELNDQPVPTVYRKAQSDSQSEPEPPPFAEPDTRTSTPVVPPVVSSPAIQRYRRRRQP